MNEVVNDDDDSFHSFVFISVMLDENVRETTGLIRTQKEIFIIKALKLIVDK